MKTRFIPTRALALDFWSDLATQFCEKHKIDYVEEEWGRDFVKFQDKIWPKYLQACYNEMALKPELGKKIRLAEEEFDDLPFSALHNMDNFSMFKDYLQSDMWLEMTRAFKIIVMKQIHLHLLPEDRNILDNDPLKELQFLNELCIKEFLKNDEESYYNSILKDLKPEQKWSYSDTETYIRCVMDELNVNEINEAIDLILREEGYERPVESKRQVRSKNKLEAEV